MTERFESIAAKIVMQLQDRTVTKSINKIHHKHVKELAYSNT